MPALRITLTKSMIGFEKSQGLTVRALGLKKVGSTVIQPDSSPIRGMIKKVKHVLAVESVEGDAPTPRSKARREATTGTE